MVVALGSKKFVVGTPPGASLFPRFLSRRYVHQPARRNTETPITLPATIPPIAIPESGTPEPRGLSVGKGLELELTVGNFA